MVGADVGPGGGGGGIRVGGGVRVSFFASLIPRRCVSVGVCRDAPKDAVACTRGAGRFVGTQSRGGGAESRALFERAWPEWWHARRGEHVHGRLNCC